MLLTPEQLAQIKQIIADHHDAFVVNNIGPASISEETRKRLESAGLVNVQPSSVEDAYLFGQVAAALGEADANKMSFDEFRRYLKAHPVALSPREDQAVQMAQAQAAQYVRGLGNRVDQKTGQLAIEADAALRRKLRDDITTNTARNIAARGSIGELKSDLGHSMADWTRDLERIALTEHQFAMQDGMAEHIARTEGKGALVAKVSSRNCCENCARLYLGPDGAPYIFKLADLESNGTNVGRRVNAWTATLGPVHPNCLCVLIQVPDGAGFDASGRLVPGGKYGTRVDKSMPIAARDVRQVPRMKLGCRHSRTTL